MLKDFLELETLFNSKQIMMTNNYFNIRIQELNFVYLTEDNYEREINFRKNKSKIIVFDYYGSIHDFKNHEYFTICFDKTIFVINKSKSFVLKYFLSHFSDSTIYCLSENIIIFLEETYLDNQIKYSENNQNKFIVSLVDYFADYFDASNHKINNKLKKINRCISGYLIQKSYQKSNINRINHLLNYNNVNVSKSKKVNGKYIILKAFINEKSQARIAYNADDEKLYIIKNHADYYDKNRLIKRELNNYMQLKHPLLPKLCDLYEENGDTFLVIEYITGKTLDKYDISSLTEHEIINIIFEMMISIHYIHSKGYVYRDLHPCNIIIDDNKTAILIDFDRTENIENKDEEFSKDFNHDYVSPEESKGESFSYNTDVYSLGKLINDMILKRKNSITDKIKNKLKKMCQYCTIEDKEKRFSISKLIRYFYINILVKNDEIKETEDELIKILEDNFNNEINDPEGLCTLGMIYEQGAYVKQNNIQAIKYYEKAANQNDIISIINLSMIYSNMPNEISKTYKCFEEGTKLNNPFSQLYFGIYKYLYSQSVMDKEFAIYYIKLAAEQHYIQAQFILGCINLLNANYQTAYEYFVQAANNPKTKNQKNNDYLKYNGYVLPNSDIIFDYEIFSEIYRMVSFFFIGTFYHNGLYVKKNINKAIDIYDKFIINSPITFENFLEEYNLDDLYITNEDFNCYKNYFHITEMFIANAYIFLVIINIDGNHVPLDINKALRFLNLPSVKNNQMAQLLLSNIYSDVKYGILDIQKTHFYLSKVENQSDFFKQYFNSSFIQNNSIYNMISFYFSKTILDFQNAFNMALSDTLNNLGYIYQNGITVKKDTYQAIRMYKLSAKYYNNATAFRNLGYIFCLGDGVEQNVNEGINYLKMSAYLNSRNSQFDLGYMYYFGTIIKKNFENAIFYFTKSANNYHDIAQFYLGMIYYQGIDVKKDIKKAIDYFRESSNLNNSFSKNNLSIILKKGEGIEKDIYRAIELLKEAIIHDNNKVEKYNLAHIYFYNDDYNQDLDNMINLLIDTPIDLNDVYIYFLCLIIIRKIQPFTYDNLKEKIYKLNLKIDKTIVSKICDMIISKDLNDYSNYQYWYDYIKKIDIMYLDHNKNLTAWILLQENNSQVKVMNDMRENINRHFYEGFGTMV